MEVCLVSMTGGIVFSFLAFLSFLAWLSMPDFLGLSEIHSIMLLMLPIIMFVLAMTQFAKD